MYDKAKQDQLRKLWKLYHAQRDRIIRRFCKKSGLDVEEVSARPWRYIYYDGLRLPPRPKDISSLTCGANTRKGTPCKIKKLYKNGRCKFHGGLSTGPKTPEGKRRSAENGKLA